MADVQKEQIEFINILLSNKDKAISWAEYGPEAKFFDPKYQHMLAAIKYAAYQGNILTKKTYLKFLENNIKDKMQIATQENLFDKATLLFVKNEDYNVLKENIIEYHVNRKAVECIDKWHNDIKNKNNKMHALKRLASSLDELQTLGSGVHTKPVIFESISEYAPKALEKLDQKRNSTEEEDEIIKTGISEVDNSIVTGIAPGTLTLFGADVGNYKCSSGDSNLHLANGSVIKVKDLFKLATLNKKLPIALSLNQRTGKIVKQPIKHVFSNGIKKTYKIKTQSGFETMVTDNHPLLTIDGWVQLKDLNVGDRIGVSTRGSFGKKTVSESEARWLGAMISDGGTSQKAYRFTNVDKKILKTMKADCLRLGGELKYTGVPADFRVNGLRYLGKKYNLDGKLSIQKNISKQVYSWNKKSLSLMLSMMYSCDGNYNEINDSISYCTSSKQLAIDVKMILTKFKIYSTIFSFDSASGKKAYRVTVADNESVKLFFSHIGFIGQKSKKFKVNFSKKKTNRNIDIIPRDYWSVINRKLEEKGKSFYGCRRMNGELRGKEGFCGNRNKTDINRGTLLKVATYLEDKEVEAVAKSEVAWDKIVSIEFYKKEETYDIEMPVHHNFVLDGLITHNTTMMLNVALNIWENGHNVLFVPLEMPRELLYWKIMSRQAQVPFDHILKPREFLTQDDWTRITETTTKIQGHNGASFYIMEKLDGHTTVSNIQREIEKRVDVFQPRAVVVDYVGILAPDQHMKNERDDVKIGLMLKSLRASGKPMALTDKGFGIISGAQIGREALKRIRRVGVNKTSFHSEDLRGSHEYSADADNIFAQMKDPSQPNNRLLLFHLKTRYGKPIFSNGESKVSLYVQPNISLIRDLNNSWVTDSQDDILGKLEGDLEDTLNFDDDDDGLGDLDAPSEDQVMAKLNNEERETLEELNNLDIDDFDTI